MMWLFAIVYVSGFFGAWLQHTIPRRLMRDVPMETIYDQIGHVREQLLDEADGIVANACGKLEVQIAVPDAAVSSGATALASVMRTGSGDADDGAPLRDFYLKEMRPFVQAPVGVTPAGECDDGGGDVRQAAPAGASGAGTGHRRSREHLRGRAPAAAAAADARRAARLVDRARAVVVRDDAPRRGPYRDGNAVLRLWALGFRMRIRTAKQRAQRIDLYYFRHARGLKRWRVLLSIAVPLVALVWVSAVAVAGGRKVYSAGPVSIAHGFAEMKCEVCHSGANATAGFRAHTTEQACLTCHDAPAHAVNMTAPPACSTCHREHRGRVAIARTSDGFCASCHADLKTTHGDPKVARAVSAFPTNIPSSPSSRPERAIPGSCVSIMPFT